MLSSSPRRLAISQKEKPCHEPDSGHHGDALDERFLRHMLFLQFWGQIGARDIKERARRQRKGNPRKIIKTGLKGERDHHARNRDAGTQKVKQERPALGIAKMDENTEIADLM